MRKYPNSKSLFSSLGSSPFLVLSVVLPLILISVFIFTSCLKTSSWSKYSMPSPLTWRVGFFDNSYTFASLAQSEASVVSYNTSTSNSLYPDDQAASSLRESSDEGAVARGVVKRHSKLEQMEAKLAKIRSSIREAARVRNLTSIYEDPDYVPKGPIYRNANAFHRYKYRMNSFPTSFS